VSADGTTDVRAAHVELVRSFLDVLANDGLAGVRERAGEYWHPELEWRPGMLSFGREVYRGLAEYREYLDEAMAKADQGPGTLSVHEIVARGDDRVLALGRVSYDSNDGSGPGGYEYGFLAEIEDGRIRSARSFLSHASAQKAADA
jgi:ketosteroid isomerase-like protein